MFNYFVRRFLLVIPTFIACTIVVFTILQVTPGGPFEMKMMELQSRAAQGGEGGGGSASGKGGQMEIPEEAKAELKRYFGLDKPIYIRYLTWLKNIVSGDFGTSYVYSEPVIDVITSKFPVSISFGLTGFILGYAISVPLGLLKALKHNTSFDVASSALIFVLYSIPGWTIGAILLPLLGGKLGWVPLGDLHSPGWEEFGTWDRIVDQVHHMILPLFCYVINGFAVSTILMKNSLLENLGQDYIRTAFAKGLTEKRVIAIHALRNSLIPIVTGLGSAFGLILAGSFLIEKTFNLDGIGLLGIKTLQARDYSVALGILVISLVIQLVGNILSDLIYATVDPRIRFN